ncbi:penicillin acylase family protein [candidate division KSB1 bacterium]|nr:penicillin acylase family protein [candidate division KSB1 bacterium]
MRNQNRRVRHSAVLITVLLFAALFLFCSQSDEVTIYRDTWGIPHIYAESENALAYAFGYCQAEDRLLQLLTSYRYAEGTMAEVFGERYVESDSVQRVWRHAEISREKFSELPSRLQEFLKHFIAGIKQYMLDHPEKVPQWAREWAADIQPWHVIAWGRTFIWDWPLGQAMDDLRRGMRKKIEPPHNSNQWVVSGQRTAGGTPIALIDPHLNFATSGHWYEARLHAGELQVCGMCVVGTPLVGLGHNQTISWAATTGGPDCADVYELDINPENPLQYRYEDHWRDISADTFVIRVKSETGISDYQNIVERCHYGPIAKRRGNCAYAIRCAYENEVMLFEQMVNMNKAVDLDDFEDALEMCQFMPQNIMFASVDGDIYYARTGRVPKRPLGYDWSAPVPGNTRKTEWQGIHPHDDLVQITNPDCGFMQNCNISPGTMMPESPLTPDKYPDYIYNDPQDRSNPRGRSALRLLAAEMKMTVERAQQIALDTSVDDFAPWQKAVEFAFDNNAHKYRELAAAVELIAGWNGRLDAENTAAPLYRFWRRQCGALFVHFNLNEDGTFSGFTEDNQKKMLIALKQAQNFLMEKFGAYDVPWGKTVQLKRGTQTWSVSGGSFRNGVSVLRAASGGLSQQTGITTVTGGQSCCMIVSLTKPIQSFSILPWGESDDPRSPHFTDQAEKLFSKSVFKPTLFQKEDLLKSLESQKTMVVPAL